MRRLAVDHSFLCVYKLITIFVFKDKTLFKSDGDEGLPDCEVNSLAPCFLLR
jgi:hypothetical protein